MIRHFLKTFIRNTVKNKWFTLIIVSGLSLGLACSLTILLWVRYELTFDSFHLNKDRIYQVQQTVQLESQEFTTDKTGGAYAPALLDGFPEMEQVVRLGSIPEVIIGLPSSDSTLVSYVEDNVWAVDSTFLEIFSFTPLLGNLHESLNKKGSIVLTRSMAEKYWGESWQKDPDIIGSYIRLDNRVDLMVTGILDNPPPKSNIQFEILIPFVHTSDFGYPDEGYGGTLYYTYLLLHHNATPEKINQEITTYIRNQHDPEIESRQFIVPLDKVHLYDEQRNYLAVYSFGAVGMFILLIACINYINLSTAAGIKRAKEVGIRKVEGANRFQLLAQFLGEAFIVTVISTQLAIIMVELFVSEFNKLASAAININYFEPEFIISVSTLIILTTLLAGTYPAFVLTRQKPTQILKYAKQPGSKGAFLRKFLVVTQFSFSIFFTICTIVTILQFRYMDTADSGFTKENIVFIPLRGQQMENYTSIKTELLRSPAINNVTTGSAVPGWVEHGEINWGKQDEDNSAIARILFSGHDFVETFNIEMAQGRFYSKDHPTDSTNAIIVNEAVVDYMGYESPIGEEFYFWGESYTIIGVVNNFNFFPLNLGGKALIMPFRSVEELMFIELNPGAEATVMEYAKQVMANFNPLFPFEYYHVDDHHPHFMSNRDEVNLLMMYFSLFGIFISCLGLYGLTIHVAEQKTKEIGIRKTFGASIPGIMSLLSGGFVKLVFIANLIAVPFAYLAMKSLLQFFTLKINLSVWIFLITVIAMLLLTVLTISGKSMQAARRNPVDSLRYE